MTVAQIGWCVAIAVFLLLEVATPTALVSVWLMVGAIAALLSTLLTPVVWVQLLVFAAVSGAALLYTRPMVARRMRGQFVPTNADRLVGEQGTVIQAVAPQQPGRVQVRGVSWAARADVALPEGAQCQVQDIAGATLYVSPVHEEAAQA